MVKDGKLANVYVYVKSGPAVAMTAPAVTIAPVVKAFAKPEVMMEVRCNNHPWMNAFINVAPTPFFAVTDADGHFTISGLPAGDYVLGAVHEKLGEQDINVTVKPHETVKADYSFSTK